MNRAEARQKDCEIREYLKDYSTKYELSPAFGEIIMDKYLEIIPEDTKREMIFLGKESVSYKLGNIRLDFRSVLVAVAEFVASLNKPESILDYMQLAIISVLCVGTITKKELNHNEAVIAYVLHKRNAYEIGITLEQLLSEIRKLLADYKVRRFDFENVDEAVDNLLNWNVLYMEEEKLYLNEQIWGNVQ